MEYVLLSFFDLNRTRKISVPFAIVSLSAFSRLVNVRSEGLYECGENEKMISLLR